MFSVTERAPASSSAPGRTPRATPLRCWLRRDRERRELAAMGEQEWRDIGLTRADVLREARKPFWR